MNQEKLKIKLLQIQSCMKKKNKQTNKETKRRGHHLAETKKNSRKIERAEFGEETPVL